MDTEILNCLNLEKPKSFFLFAGAGSGKTRTLVKVLNEFGIKYETKMRLTGQRVAVITYTNAACEEVERRLEYNPLFSISTIHSFIWELIKGFNNDIKEWKINKLAAEIDELKGLIAKGKLGAKINYERQQKIEKNIKIIDELPKIKQFTYSPNGMNQDKQSLSHNDVISIGAYFLQNKPLMQKILVRKFPILFIDESQDTSKELINALFEVERIHYHSFTLGLFGDTMQRIYASGKEDLGRDLPARWVTPRKKMNHRCPPRIINLINRIRSDVDDKEQLSRTDKAEGIVRLFIAPIESDREKIEREVARQMTSITGDENWELSRYTTLILEHHMAAKRLGFMELFEPLYKSKKYNDSLLKGTSEELNFFINLILPLIDAHKIGDQFTIARILCKYSPLMTIINEEIKQLVRVKETDKAVKQFFNEIDKHIDPTCLEVLRLIKAQNLFNLPDTLAQLLLRSDLGITSKDENEAENIGIDDYLDELLASFHAPISQVRAYGAYLSGYASFMTHQGVKGLEFPRVMTIIDDSDARGFLFNYEKLFGAEDKSKTDIKNEKDGKETSIDRTRRLFYVACSRAEESLAIVAYSKNPEAVKTNVLLREWFEEEEVITYSGLGII
ncbi:UvrD-helicase domain-containing protein [Bacillus sp. B-jedd]|uniref:UvrD-helicase domain-containing protein n=1 Tax=Bacillus sp. B-jedd TaxID=1476857 RepID=UPI001E602993|nr:UvrD-helicase domain-containing protein [Bacillus sp. B-jedd]